MQLVPLPRMTLRAEASGSPVVMVAVLVTVVAEVAAATEFHSKCLCKGLCRHLLF
jgi:hypothetical protein